MEGGFPLQFLVEEGSEERENLRGVFMPVLFLGSAFMTGFCSLVDSLYAVKDVIGFICSANLGD